MTFEEINERLKEKSGNHPGFYNNIIPGGLPSMGVRVPELRKIAKDIVKGDYIYFLKEYPIETLEHELLHVMVIGYMKKDIEESMKYFEEYMPRIHDWCVNDTMCQGFVIARKYQKEVWHMLMKHRKTKKEFVSRAISVTLLSHYLNDEYIDLVISVIDQLNTDEYNAKMGVAWCVAAILGKYPEKGLAYMRGEENHLDSWTYKKAIQKAIESNQVSDELKQILREMRNK